MVSVQKELLVQQTIQETERNVRAKGVQPFQGDQREVHQGPTTADTSSSHPAPIKQGLLKAEGQT